MNGTADLTFPPAGRHHPSTMGGSRPPSSRTFRRRRVFAAAAGAAVLSTVLSVAGVLPALFGDTSPAQASLLHPHVYVVRDGDTLWAIATSLQPGRDPRPLVGQLEEQLHGATLQAGERLVLP